MNEAQEIKIGLTDGDDSNELKSSCRIESYVPQQVESFAVEWKNGDDVEYDNTPDFKNKFRGTYVCFDSYTGVHVILNDDGYWPINSDCIRKPETQQQRKERERIESIKEIENFICELPISEMVLPFKLAERIVDKTGYRKEAKSAG